MKYLVYLLSALNLCAGVRFLLNAVGILQTSKFANTSNVFFGVTLTGAVAVALYLSFAQQRHGLALLIDAAPWLITLVLLLANMLFGDYK